MTRRELLAAGIGLTAGLAPVVAAAATKQPPVVWPRPLRKGDRVMLVSPASAGPFDETDAEENMARVRKWGYEPVMARHADRHFGYLGGTDLQRAEDLNHAFADPSIKGIFCLRGGYGCTRLLAGLDYDVIRDNPKVLLGYSDITALHVAIHQETGLVTFHGPVVTSSESEFADGWRDMLLGERSAFAYAQPDGQGPEFDLWEVCPGSVTAPVIGGNLTLLASMCGTPWQLCGSGKIIAIEDVEEKPYRIDRMLTQLVSAGVFEGAKGVLLGQFTDCEKGLTEADWLVKDVVKDIIGRLGLPCLAGCAFGHVKEKWTLPIGGTVHLETGSRTVRFVG